MKLLLSFFIFISVSSVLAQNPGNVGTPNLTAWFRPDALPLGNVTTWSTTLSSIGGVTVTDVAAPFPQATNTPAGNISNYNTTLFFNGNSATSLQSLQNTTSLNLLQNSTTTSQGTFFCAYYLPTGAPSNGHMMLYNNSPNAIQFRNLGAIGRIALGLSFNSTNATRDWAETNVPTIISYKGNRSTATSFRALKNDATIPTSTTASSSSGALGLYFGAMGTSGGHYNGYVHEYIFYNTDLSDANIRRVQTYLAIKYGVTLDNIGGGIQGDYVATDGTTIWDASVNPSYHRDVIGIGRDDNQGLMQKQSHSFSDDFRIHLSTLAPTNVANTGVFNNDLAYITMGHNIGTCGTPAANAEAPTGVSSRLGEEWKVQNTNFTQTFNWDVKVDTCTNPGFSVGAVDLSLLRLLVDTDGDFTNAASFGSLSGLTFAYANGRIRVNGISNIHLPEDSIRYFTLAYNATTVSFSGTNSICTGASVVITVNIQNAPGPINVTYNNGVNNITLNNITNGHTFTVTPTITTTYTVQGFSSFLDCCGGGSGGIFTINVSPFPIVTANASLNPICIGQSTTISGGGATTYAWSNGTTTISNNSSQSPTATTTYTVIGQNAAGCADTAAVTVVVNPLPITTLTSSSTSICRGESITLTAGGAATYNFPAGILNNVAFVPNPPLTQNTDTFTIQGTSAAGCNALASVTITLNNSPTVLAQATDSVICVGESTTLFGSGAVTYLWNNGVTNNVPISPIVSGMYTVVGTNANNCSNIDSVFITVNPNPMVTATASPPIICQGESSQILAIGANTYSWTPNIVNGTSVSPQTNTTYTVVGTSALGCTGTATVNLVVNPLPSVIALANPQVVCEGNETTLIGSGADSYTWTNGVLNGIPFTPTTTATYTVTGIDALNCSNTADITVIVVPIPFFTIGPDTTTCPQAPAILSSNANFASYLWSTGETTPEITVGTVGSVSLVVVDDEGCVYTDNLILTLAPDCFPTYSIPNIFTPNGDNSNDFFFIDATNISSQSITIVNRWNNVMFNKTGPKPVWDGRTNDGAIAADGVYYVTYILDAENGDKITGTAFFHLVGK